MDSTWEDGLKMDMMTGKKKLTRYRLEMLEIVTPMCTHHSCFDLLQA